MALTCLSRTMDLGDLEQLGDQVARLASLGIVLTVPHRRWEAALALHAFERWKEAGHTTRGPALVADVTVADLCVGGTPLTDQIVALSVIEHTLDPEAFLYRCSCLLAPGGLLVLTFAYWNRCGPDTALGYQQRQRIYCPKELTVLRAQAALLHLQPFGGVDPTWHGSQIDDHSIASLVLEKRR